MPKKILPRIITVAPGSTPLSLIIQWNNAEQTKVDISILVQTFRLYAPLRDDPALFEQVHVGEQGTDVVWPNEIDMAADTLWRLAQEQAGLIMSPDAFKDWRESKSYTLDAAAKALGISRRMVAYYEQGTKPIPRVVALATRGLA